MPERGKITPHDIDFDAGAPRSRSFNDIYFNRNDGLLEARHVFLHGVGAPELWQGRKHTVIAETGFGTGLNFLATWALWRQTAATDQYLHYISVEGFPLARDDLGHALRPWTELKDLAAKLIAAYPPLTAGFHLLPFDGGRVRLTLLFGEAAAVLKNLSARVDAWYLDGFAPDRNAEMWRPEVMAEIARLSNLKARLASFTVAGEVRRALADEGFSVEKAPGFGKKRECLRAVFTGPRRSSVDKAPWFAPPPAKAGKVAIIGGGIAGLMTATALQNLGADVSLYEAADAVACAASGNPAGVVEPWLDRGGDAAARAHLAAYVLATRRYKDLAADIWQPCGVMRLLTDARAKDHGKAVLEDGLLPLDHLQYLDAEVASAMAGVTVQHPALYLPLAGMARPQALASHLAAGLDVRCNTKIVRLEESDIGWRLLTTSGAVAETADSVIITAALGATKLLSLPFSFEARAGEITYLPTVAALENLQTILTYGGYLTPAVAMNGGRGHVLGATYDVVPPDHPVSNKTDGHYRNVQALRGVMPDISLPDPSTLTGRMSVRATTTDHMPVMGGIPDMTHYAAAYDGLRHGRRGPYPAAQYRNGLYLLTALGSRGFLTAPLLAESLAAEVMGLPDPVERTATNAFHPARFWLRQIKKTG